MRALRAVTMGDAARFWRDGVLFCCSGVYGLTVCCVCGQVGLAEPPAAREYTVCLSFLRSPCTALRSTLK